MSERTSAAVDDRARTVVVTAEESLPGIVERLREAGSGGHALQLVVPIDSNHLLTAAEFRALKAAIDENRLALTLRTADPLRLQLAERLGIRAQTMARPKAKTPPDVASPAASATIAPHANGAVSGERKHPTESRSGGALAWPARSRERRCHRSGSRSARSGFSIRRQRTLRAAGCRWPRCWSRWWRSRSLALRFVLPQAVVRIVPKTAPVTGSVLFDVTVDGEPLADGAAFALPTQLREVQVIWLARRW